MRIVKNEGVIHGTAPDDADCTASAESRNIKAAIPSPLLKTMETVMDIPECACAHQQELGNEQGQDPSSKVVIFAVPIV